MRTSKYSKPAIALLGSVLGILLCSFVFISNNYIPCKERRPDSMITASVPCYDSVQIKKSHIHKGDVLYNDVFYFDGCGASQITFKFNANFSAIQSNGRNDAHEAVKIDFYRLLNTSDSPNDQNRFASVSSDNTGGDFTDTKNFTVTHTFNTPPTGRGITIYIIVSKAYTSAYSDNQPQKFYVDMSPPDPAHPAIITWSPVN